MMAGEPIASLFATFLFVLLVIETRDRVDPARCRLIFHLLGHPLFPARFSDEDEDENEHEDENEDEHECE
jgi:hypothetical protein